MPDSYKSGIAIAAERLARDIDELALAALIEDSPLKDAKPQG